MVISDFEWDDFVNHNFVSVDVIEVIALRIISGCVQTDREIAIYNEHSKRIENRIRKIRLKK